MEIISLDFRGETIHRNLGAQRFGSLSLIQDLLVKYHSRHLSQETLSCYEPLVFQHFP